MHSKDTAASPNKGPLKPDGGSDPEPAARRRSRVHPESLGLAPGCKPVRKIAKKSKRISRPGVFASAKTFDGRAIRTESILEMEGLAHIEVNARYVRVAPQPHRLIFHVEDGRSTQVHTYVPDLAILTRDGQVIVVDFKWSFLRERPDWAALEPVIREAYRLDHGVTYRVLTEEHLLVEPRRTNVAILMMHRPMVANEGAITAVRSAIASLDMPSTIGALRSASGLASDGPADPAFSALMELAVAGEVRIDMSRLFDDASVIGQGALA